MNTTIKVALFDIDETLLNHNSMLNFLYFFFKEYYGVEAGKIKADEYKFKVNQLWRNFGREHLNRLYYAHYKGVKKSTLESLGRTWFQENIFNKSSAIRQPVLERLYAHKKQNYKIIFVSGSFFAPLTPLAEYLEINDLLCIKPVVHQGILTGDITGIQTIGKGKATAVIKHFENTNIDWGISYAYGDHISDLPMLKLVGNPVVVGNDQELLKIAREHHWELILN